ncbi:hypothetical protein BUALT_Bualt01G0243700 [Buddleja alternifolia]|uniref:Uncharacterized protein n=1 Tax=Buddleja alternifolia TaxID=168488 RepID=A0AAV6YAW2_9LAMI|nr:hypothetical protein BUALT_Bualt01G0243700 [Buddleja alternifolia]
MSMSNVAKTCHQHHRHSHCRSPIPPVAICILVSLFLVGLCVSTFILIVIHNAVFFILLLCISTLVAAFLLWNSRNAAVLFFLHSFPESDLSLATHGQLVKITGVVSCGNVSLESSYEKVGQCVYTSTLLYERRNLCLKPSNVKDLCLLWRLAYSERLSTDFYITDLKSGIRALVKAGQDSEVIPLITESKLIETTGKRRDLSADFRKWLRDKNLSAEARLLCLEEGYIKEGSCVSVIGVLHKSKDAVMIVQPHEVISTGCLWSKLLLPADVEGVIIGTLKTADPTN